MGGLVSILRTQGCVQNELKHETIVLHPSKAPSQHKDGTNPVSEKQQENRLKHLSYNALAIRVF